ncbi:MAG: hypothetical protein OCD02_14575 [Spirochaetaceae bacterium]
MKYKVVSLKERYDLFEKSDELNMEAWDEFMLHDPVADENWMTFIDAYKDYQLIILDENDEMAASMVSVPIKYDGDIKDLPDEGWDWAVKKSISDLNDGLIANILVGLQIVVYDKYRGKGLSSIAVKEMAKLGKEKGFKNLVIPVRPSDKHKYPLVDMEQYITFKNDKDLPLDNWLRVHVKAGGNIINVCTHAMEIPGTIKDWSEWTGLKFPISGPYIIKGALNPVLFNVEKDSGIYIEPNVWILHKL